jgi:hypothetical protein
MNILTVNLLLSTLVFWIAARIYVVPKLPTLSANAILLPILLLHSFRHLGLMFLAPGVVDDAMPRQFAYPAAYGDLLAALLALAAIPAVVRNARGAPFLVWLFNVEGTVDLITAIALGTYYDTAPHMGAAYWIPSFWVPALLVTHYLTFLVLCKYPLGKARLGHSTGSHGGSDDAAGPAAAATSFVPDGAPPGGPGSTTANWSPASP